MPASAYSSSLSWGLYLVAMLLLVAALFPALDGVAGYADAFASSSTAEGVALDLVSLRPGLSFVLQVSSASPASTISLRGHYVVAVSGSTTTSVRVGLSLPELTIAPGESYLVALNGSKVEVAPVVRD